jgi:hypothetical protein
MLMRDDREVRSFRIKSGILRFLIILFLLLLATGGTGIGIGVYYWKQIALLLPRYEESQRALADTRIELMELRSFKAVAMAQNNGTQPLAQNEEVETAEPARSVPATAVANATALAPAADNATLTTAPADDSAGLTAFLSPLAASALPQISDENCPIRINDFSAQALNNQSLRIRYNLSVPDGGAEGRPVSGLTRYVAVLADGSRLDLLPNNPGSSRFSINYMKPISTSVRLPQGHLVPEIRGVNVLVETMDGTLYGQNYAFPSGSP